MKWFFLMALTLLSHESAYALNRSKCGHVYGNTNGLGKIERTWAKMFSATTSTGQFLTSTGGCSLIGGVSKDEKKFFIADNADQLMKDIARAEGDYLSAVAILYNCQSPDQVSMRLQENVTKIFGQKLEHSSTKVSEELDALMTTDSQLKKYCTAQGA